MLTSWHADMLISHANLLSAGNLCAARPAKQCRVATACQLVDKIITRVLVSLSIVAKVRPIIWGLYAFLLPGNQMLGRGQGLRYLTSTGEHSTPGIVLCRYLALTAVLVYFLQLTNSPCWVNCQHCMLNLFDSVLCHNLSAMLPAEPAVCCAVIGHSGYYGKSMDMWLCFQQALRSRQQSARNA